jgi:hypothetical protein
MAVRRLHEMIAKTYCTHKSTTMEDIEAFYALAFKYGFIDHRTHLQIILKLGSYRTNAQERDKYSPHAQQGSPPRHYCL